VLQVLGRQEYGMPQLESRFVEGPPSYDLYIFSDFTFDEERRKQFERWYCQLAHNPKPRFDYRTDDGWLTIKVFYEEYNDESE
jgi:hypothetical protein